MSQPPPFSCISVMKLSTISCTCIASFGRLVCHQGRKIINKGEKHTVALKMNNTTWNSILLLGLTCWTGSMVWKEPFWGVNPSNWCSTPTLQPSLLPWSRGILVHTNACCCRRSRREVCDVFWSPVHFATYVLFYLSHYRLCIVTTHLSISGTDTVKCG
jgi:hypothetical protein